MAGQAATRIARQTKSDGFRDTELVCVRISTVAEHAKDTNPALVEMFGPPGTDVPVSSTWREHREGCFLG